VTSALPAVADMVPKGHSAAAPASLLPPAAPRLPDLPVLREDLVLFPSSDNPDGSPTWAVQDPVRNKFVQIGWLEFEMLLRWQTSPLELMKALAQETPLRPRLEDVLVFAHFLRQQGLVRLDTRDDLAAARRIPGKPGIGNWHWWLHNYLFFRIALARPDQLLGRIVPRLEWLFSRSTLIALGLLCGLGALLALRQWELFFRTFVDSLTLAGLVSFAFALMLAKALHELGHAVVATRYGVRVAHMGVAFLVMWPMLYTDTSESWRLRDHKKRLHIAAAGMSVEMILAGLSLLGWALSPPGALRSAFFYLATTSLVMTLALNISPFMRFDGYYVLSDALDMPNLHERSGAIARTWLRRTLLGWRDPWPEHFEPGKHTALLLFALGTWVYRLTLFLGIAVAVYLMFFKVLGIFLFMVEIIWFVCRPVWNELRVWRMRKRDIQRGRARIWLLALMAGIALLAFPWAHDIHAPAQLRAEHRTLFSPIAGQITALHAAGSVDKGAALVELDSSKLRSDVLRAQISMAATRAALASAEIAANESRESIGKLGETVLQFQAEGRAAGLELARMRLGAEFAGRWTDVDPALAVGSWVRPQDAIGTLVDESAWLVEAWVDEASVRYLKPGATGRFYAANHIDAPIKVKVVEVDSVRASVLPHIGLASDYGGPIPATASPDGKSQIPREALYLVRLQLEAPPEQVRWSRGRITVNGERHSLLWQAVSYAGSVLIRESNF
jgi:putative peptide zinc metalloprotease protein